MNQDYRYITKQRLRELGLTEPDSVILPFLERINRKIANEIDAEIGIEISNNYTATLLQEYLDLRDAHGFSSPIVQSWLKEHIAAIDEITADYIESTLNDIRTSALLPGKGDQSPRRETA